ncbi:hypothetical protein E2L07_01420 [Halalkalibacterium halodurans]|uniref:N-acetylmuramoyl-L-alanine amidase n=1 Tax=Halalkalibacterium halodurans TaxID=86665 RepID=UPI001067599E|nr:N-acetylmuramoyl-L-alanine amidase [Halalkalibacterium halodurans]TES57688.1 hypothetical protein E2L07_01420 [Halalkalibacterium halodurans]
MESRQFRGYPTYFYVFKGLHKIFYVINKVILIFLFVIISLSNFSSNQILVSAEELRFNDVPTSAWGHDEITFLNEKGIIQGYPGGSFKPNSTITRAQAAIIMTNALQVGGKKVESPTFPDVSTDHWASEAIEQAAALGIFVGINGEFRPNEKISKAQVATIISRSFKLKSTISTKFTDVKTDHWAADHIAALEANGIIKVEGEFQPNKAATRSEFSVFIARSIEPTFRIEDTMIRLYQGRVSNTSTTLNVRLMPSTDSSVLGRLKLGETVDVYEETGDWKKIKYLQSWGYVHKDYITKLTANETESKTPNSSEKKVIDVGRVTTASLHLREEPSSNSTSLGKLKMNDVVEIYEYEGKWALIKQNDSWAYIHSDYLAIRDMNQKNLQDVVITIDPGHGGKDPGTNGHGLQEKDIVLDVGLVLEKKLKELDAKPILTRSDDRFIELNDRAKIANNANASVFVSIHANSAVSSSANGLESYWNSAYSNEESEELAEKINKRLVEELGMKDRGVKEANFAVIRQSNMPSVLVELGFVTNSGDAEIMKQSEFNEKAASAILEGIKDYYRW